MTDDEISQKLAAELRDFAKHGATFMQLIDLIHERLKMPKYSRGIVMKPLRDAFGLRASDFTDIVFACEVFGDGASVTIAETEESFGRRLEELRLNSK